MKQLSDADIKLQVASARIGEIKNRVYELEGERNDQIRLEQLEKQIRGLRASVISRNLFNLKQDISINNENKNNLEDKLSTTKSDQKSIINTIDSKELEKAKFIETFVDKISNKQYEIFECFERGTLKLYTWKLFFQFSFLQRRVRTDALCIGFRPLLPRI